MDERIKSIDNGRNNNSLDMLEKPELNHKEIKKFSQIFSMTKTKSND